MMMIQAIARVRVRKMIKWKSRSTHEIYLGKSPQHSRNLPGQVAMILTGGTGHGEQLSAKTP
jgi:hypothetical protein